jgi:hypothetical protein
MWIVPSIETRADKNNPDANKPVVSPRKSQKKIGQNKKNVKFVTNSPGTPSPC